MNIFSTEISFGLIAVEPWQRKTQFCTCMVM